MAVMSEAAHLGDFGQFFLAGKELNFCFVDLALEQEMLWRDAQEFRKAAMKMERAEMRFLGDLTQTRAAMELILHEPHGRNQSNQLMIRLEIGAANRAPIARIRLEAEEDERAFAKGGIGFVNHDAKRRQAAARIRELNLIGDSLFAINMV